MSSVLTAAPASIQAPTPRLHAISWGGALAEPDAAALRPDRVRAIFDVELTNCCNAHCIMCPREKTPAMGLMEKGTFRKVVERAVEYGRVESFVMCGLGEPLLHPDIVKFVGAAAEAGLKPSIVTNGSLLTREMSRALVAAGLRNVNVSLGGFTRETYEAVHRGLKFDDVYRNTQDFLEAARGRAFLNIQISPTRATIHEAASIATFWRARGARFCFIFPFAASRGGSLSTSDGQVMQCQTERLYRMPHGCINIEELFRPTRRDARIMHRRAQFVCYPKDRVTFVSWQGLYQLCCSDYEKKHSVGSVFQRSVDEAYAHKARASPETNTVCAGCDFSGGDLKPRNIRFYIGAAVYLARSALATFA